MKNLKITVNFASSAILNRYLTIDNILLALHFNKLTKKGKIKGFVDIKKYIKKNKKDLFIEYRNGVLSGSIWYIEKNIPVWIENHIFTKRVPVKEIYQTTGKKVDTTRGEFKKSIIGFEALNIPSIYFYVKGNREYIEELLKDLKYVGKKGSAGFGIVKKVEVEEIEKDKSFMLDEFTPAKPLPCDKWNVKSKKVAFYRALPPYYLKEDIVVCYMPTRALIEMQDKSYFKENFETLTDKHERVEYLSASAFARMYAKDLEEVPLFEKVSKKVKYVNNEKHKCIICGSIKTEGLVGNPKHILPKTFNDYAFLDKGNFICSDCLWSTKQEKHLGNTYIDFEKMIYLQGGKMTIKGAEQQKFRDDFFRNLDLLKPPFLISLKSTKNSQHTVFKNKVAISNAIIPISYGTEEEVLVDVELLKQAIEDLERITKEYPCIKKTHLCNTEKITGPFVKLSKKCMDKKHIQILQDFWKKYDRSVRKVLNRIML